MLHVHAIIESLRAFLDAGGPVLWVIGAVAALMGFVIIERYWYVYLVFPDTRAAYLRAWQERQGMGEWQAHRVRQAMISEARLGLQRLLPLLKTLVALCPLLGLLGTVTGMIRTFKAITVAGIGNPAAMAGGIAEALITTAAGLLVAIPALVAYRYLRGRVDALVIQMEKESIKLVQAIDRASAVPNLAAQDEAA
jgi:biopolymer transport protein ExbB